MSPYLPFDLEELILCHLQCEPSSLKACSLVCHIFRHICQRFLFKDIIVRYPSTSPATVESSVCPFLLHEFLQSTPQIANAVRGVDIIADSYRLQDLDNFLPCPSFLENIRSIGLDTNSARPIYWCFLLPRTQQSLYNLSHSNRIVNIRFRRVFDLPISLIAECPSLEGLSLISVTFQRDNMLHAPDGAWKPSAMRLERPHLKSLHLSISTEAFRTFTDTLTGSPALLDLSALVKLSVSIFSLRFDYNRLNSFLHAVGNSLELFCFSPIAPGNRTLVLCSAATDNDVWCRSDRRAPSTSFKCITPPANPTFAPFCLRRSHYVRGPISNPQVSPNLSPDQSPGASS